MKGYLGKLLEVDLDSGELSDTMLDEKIAADFLGGRGYGIKFLLDKNPKKVDPLSPENYLIFMTGPYTGTSGAFNAFYNVTTKSPLTNTCLSSHSGGFWGPWLKKAGYDGIIIKGRSEDPVFLVVDDGAAELRDASDLWGLDVHETTDVIQEDFKGSVATIGPAGENQVRFASIINERHRAAGRGGAGAVMGSKNLKAIAVKGKQQIPVADSEKLRKSYLKAVRTAWKEPHTTFGQIGTPQALALLNEVGGLPTKNFQTGYFEEAEKITGETLNEKHSIQNVSCYNCPIGCGSINKTDREEPSALETEGPEWETLMSFGSNCMNSNLASILEANDLCDRLGMDTITMGNTIALAMEMYEEGVLTEDDIESPLNWGDSETILKLVKKTAARNGFGNKLAEGSARLADELNYESFTFRDMEPPAYDPRAVKGMALAFATSPRGACHMRAPMYVLEVFKKTLDRLELTGKEKILKEMQDRFAIMDSMLICKLAARHGECGDWKDLADLLTFTTGVNFTRAKLMEIGERVFDHELEFNEREGVGGPTKPPSRIFEPMPSGPSQGEKVDEKEWEKVIKNYYRLRGREY